MVQKFMKYFLDNFIMNLQQIISGAVCIGNFTMELRDLVWDTITHLSQPPDPHPSSIQSFCNGDHISTLPFLFVLLI
jgi:hypothetical protein